MIVSWDAIDSLLGLLANPPYLATEIPSPIPATETATLEAATPSSETAAP
jgi:hypothetical protein